MEKSSTTTGSDALYMTDDLEGRLGPEDLVTPAKKAVYLEEEDGPAEDVEDAVMKPERVRASVTIEYDIADSPDATNRTEKVSVHGYLDSFSFGKGWLVSLASVEEGDALAMGRAFAVYEGVSRMCVFATVAGDKIKLKGELDFTVGYGYSGCTFSVSADEGSYVDA